MSKNTVPHHILCCDCPDLRSRATGSVCRCHNKRRPRPPRHYTGATHRLRGVQAPHKTPPLEQTCDSPESNRLHYHFQGESTFFKKHIIIKHAKHHEYCTSSISLLCLSRSEESSNRGCLSLLQQAPPSTSSALHRRHASSPRRSSASQNSSA